MSLQGLERRTFRIQVGNFAAGATLDQGVMSIRPPAIHPSIHPKIHPNIHPFIHPLFPLSSVKEENITKTYVPSLRYVLGYSCQGIERKFLMP